MFCRKCGIQLDDSAVFCSKCGEKQIIVTEDAGNSSSDPIELVENAENVSAIAVETESEISVEDSDREKNETLKKFIGKTCPYCKTAITAEDEISVCSACETALHKSCWEDNGACATFGCTGKPYGTVVCRNCGADISANQLYCSKCGSLKSASETPVVTQTAACQNLSICSNCGCNVEPQQKYCNQCGNQLTVAINNNAALQSSIETYNAAVSKNSGKSVKSKVAWAAVVLVVLAIFVGVAVNSFKQKAAEEYIAKAENFSDLCWSAGSDLEDVGNDVQTYWNKYITTYGTKVYYMGHYMYSIDDAVAYALSDNSAKISSIKADWSSIQSLYNELKDVPNNNSNLNAIYNEVKDVYYAFEDMYDCVIDVSGNYTTYKTEFGNCDSELADALGRLDDILE